MDQSDSNHIKNAQRAVIDRATHDQDHVCGKCKYKLVGVPIEDDQRIVCPECGYTMRFVVSVRLVADDPEYDREIRQSLGRTEKIVARVFLGFFALGIVCLLLIASI